MYARTHIRAHPSQTHLVQLFAHPPSISPPILQVHVLRAVHHYLSANVSIWTGHYEEAETHALRAIEQYSILYGRASKAVKRAGDALENARKFRMAKQQGLDVDAMK